jgi:hypothetical protein
MTAYARQLAITAMLALVVAICTPVFVHRRDFDVAFSQWRKNQTAENSGRLNVQARKTQSVVLCVELAEGVIVFIALNAGWFLTQRLNAGRPARS